MSMSQARFNAIFSGMTAVAKKVYEAVPIAEKWTQQQIASELHRNGSPVELRLVAGCLNSLISAGLVTEPGTGLFRRETVRAAIKKTVPAEQTEQKEEMKTNTEAAAKAPQACPIDKLGQLAQRVAQLSAMAKELAEEINEAAIEAQAKMEENTEAVKKFQQLQSLLKGV